MDCLHCGKKLSMVKKLTTGEFCSAAHKKAYLQEQEKFALARLLENQDRLVGKTPGAEKRDLGEAARDGIGGRSATFGRDSAVQRDPAVDRDSGGSRAAKRPLRGKAKKEDAQNTPVEGDYLIEPVRAAVGPQYLALPEMLAKLHVDPVLPEFEAAVEAARTDHQTIDSERDNPFFAVSNRFGLEAIFGSVPQEECHADYLALAEFAAHEPLAGLKACGSGKAAHFAGLVQRPAADSEVNSDWLLTPARRESEGWELAINHLADAELAAEQSFGVQWSCPQGALPAAAASDGARLEAFGPKRFSFSRLPESPVPASKSERWDPAGVLAWDSSQAFELLEEPAGQSSPVAFDAAPVALMTRGFEPESGLPRRGSIHELAGQTALAPDLIGKLGDGFTLRGQTTLRGEVKPLGTEYGYWDLPLASGCCFDEVILRYESDGLASLHLAGMLAPHKPRGPYDLSRANRYFPPPPRIASVPRLVSRDAHPRLETRLVAVEGPPLVGAASQVSLRANGELKLSRGNIFLPKIKHKIRPVILDESFYDALGQLTAGNRDFSIAGFKKHWNLAPNDLRWVAMAIPIVLGLVWYSSSGGGVTTSETDVDLANRAGTPIEKEIRVKGPGVKLPGTAQDREKQGAGQLAGVASGESVNAAASGTAGGTSAEPSVFSRVFGDDSMREVKRSIQNRAAVELSDDFRQGLGEWSGVGDWASGWSYDKAGFLRPRQLGFYTPTLELTDYRFEFLGQIERKALSWVFRAADSRNYYVNRLEIVEPGPLPDVVLVRYAVIGGKAGPRTVIRLPMQVQMDTLYRIRVDVQGKNFVTTVQGQVVDVFSDERITRGGVGFFAAPGEDVRLRWVEVSHQYDFLGRLCAFLVPYNVSK